MLIVPSNVVSGVVLCPNRAEENSIFGPRSAGVGETG